MQAVVPLRDQFRRESTVEGRKQIAETEFSAWKHYLMNRKEHIAAEMPDFHIGASTKTLLREQFDRMKDRKTMGLPAEELADMHGEFASKFKIRMPINPVHFGHLIYPYQGYLANFPDRHYSFDELLTIYENQIAAGLERSTGRNLFASELSCLCFWMVNQPDSGAADWNQMQELMTAFRFKIDTLPAFRTEFKSLLSR